MSNTGRLLVALCVTPMWAAVARAQASATPQPSQAPHVPGPLDVAAVAPRAPSAPACARSQPASAFRRVPVFLWAEVVDSADRAARPSVDIAADMVARRVRAALGGAESLAAADSLVWQGDLVEGVRVTVRRNGRTSWRAEASSAADRADGAGVALLSRALAAAADSGELFVPDELMRGDSLVYVMRFAHPRPDVSGAPLARIRRRNAAPVFTVSAGLLIEAAPVPGELARHLRYPVQLQMGGFQGHVVLRFVVDTTGRAVRETVRDANPDVATGLAPHLREAYRLFLGAARDAVLRSAFSPATVVGCRVRQLVHQPISYELLRQ